MSLYADIAFGRKTELSQAELNRRWKLVADAIEALRAFAPDWEAEVNALRNIGLERINEALIPAYEQIIELANLGALLSASSTSEVTIGMGPKTFVLPESQRLNFAPTPFLMASANGDFDLSVIGLLSSYDPETGVLVIAVERVSGDGTFSSWSIGPIATTDNLEALRDQVAADAATATTKAAEAIAARDTAETHKTDAQTAKAAAEAALSTFQAAWYGARATEPAGAAPGSQYLDTSQTPNVVKVLTESGWAPTVTVSIGGSRTQAYTATAGQTGPFTVDGGFSNGSVNVNGVSFYEGNGVEFDREAGTFTMDDPLVEGDFVVFEGYLANDVTDVYTKQELNNGAADPWAFQPLFSPIPFYAHLDALPPTDKGYRYVLLTAGEDGVGEYNEGVLINEVISGSAPTISATAEIDLPESPAHGSAIYLLNTSKLFLRPGTVDTVEAGQNLSHTHSGTTDNDTHNHSGTLSVREEANTVPGSEDTLRVGQGKLGGDINTISSGLSTDNDTHAHSLNINANGGNEARPRNLNIPYIMRIL